MDRKPESARIDPRAPQSLLEPWTIIAKDISPLQNLTLPIWSLWETDARTVQQKFTIPGVTFSEMCNSLIKSLKLRQRQRCLDIRILEIKSENGMQVVSTSSAMTATLIL